MNPDPTLSLACGLTAGICQTAVFNPYDRAMYLSTQLKRPFLSPSNWTVSESLVGIFPSVLQRAVASGLYFPMEQYARIWLSTDERTKGEANALAGILSGALTGAVTAPINAAKFAQWREASGKSALDSARDVFRINGSKGLMRAAPVTVCRDIVFGMTFSYLRHFRIDTFGLIDNIGAALIATIISSPLNYVRLMKYSSDGPPHTTMYILRELLQKASTLPLRHRPSFVFKACNAGWGALRVGLGMGISSQVYDSCTQRYSHKSHYH
jgi:hypothetical protein